MLFGAQDVERDVTPEFSIAEARPGQLGAVARAAAPCVVRYRARG